MRANRLILSALILSVPLCGHGAAIAKDKELSLQDAIKLCSEFEDDGEKLLCFEALANSVKGVKPAKNAAKSEADSTKAAEDQSADDQRTA